MRGCSRCARSLRPSALLATTRIQDRIIDHEIFWMSGIGALERGCHGSGCVTAIARPTPHELSIASSGRLASSPGWWWRLVGAADMTTCPRSPSHARRPRSRCVDRTDRELPADPRRVSRPLFEIEPPVWPIAAGALLQIDKAGARFAVGERWAPMFGDRFVPTGEEDGTATISGSAVSTSVTPSR